MEISRKETLYQGYYTLKKLWLKLSTEKEVDREQFLTPNSTAALVYDTVRKEMILVKQFRIGPEKPLVEIVAGKIEQQTAEETIRREILEETGYQTDQLQFISSFYTTPGPVTEKMSLFYAEVSQQVAKGGGLATENEAIEIIRLSVEDWLAYPFEDAKSIMVRWWFQLHQLDKC